MAPSRGNQSRRRRATAFCHAYLAELALSAGDLDEAERELDAGAELVPGDPLLLMGRAHVAAVRADVALATRTYRQAVALQPLAEHLVEYGEFLLSVGDEDEARVQFARARDVRQRFADHGMNVDLDIALVEAEHGDPAAAVAAARREFDRRQNGEAHDALAWALHGAGQDAEALEHARRATDLLADPSFLYHRGVIEAELGMEEPARRSLSAALDAGPYFSPPARAARGPAARRAGRSPVTASAARTAAGTRRTSRAGPSSRTCPRWSWAPRR